MSMYIVYHLILSNNFNLIYTHILEHDNDITNITSLQVATDKSQISSNEVSPLSSSSNFF